MIGRAVGSKYEPTALPINLGYASNPNTSRVGEVGPCEGRVGDPIARQHLRACEIDGSHFAMSPANQYLGTCRIKVLPSCQVSSTCSSAASKAFDRSRSKTKGA